jgi:hypothetical protein
MHTETEMPGSNHGEMERLYRREWVSGMLATHDRRRNERVPHNVDVRLQELSPVSGLPNCAVSAQVQNLSRGGICVSSELPLTTSCVVQCEISLPDMPVAIPTLMQVVWVDEIHRAKYVCGLQYLL